ncbi:class I SAM-dependent methyltransferase [Roseospira marina]|nr:class I SAM-dependent methyltransferase [Roseospira marina]
MLLSELKRRYEAGDNITRLLQTEPGINETRSIEIAYDLQAGSYARAALENPANWVDEARERTPILNRYLRPGDTLLDAGCGENTNTCAFVDQIPPSVRAYGFDLSVSRLVAGRRYVRQHWGETAADRITVFCGRMDRIPLASSSVDVVMTSHAVEPNRGQEAVLLRELLRVARRYLVLFEPCYEETSEEGRRRMDSLGYVRDLDAHLKALGAKVVERTGLTVNHKPLNPTVCWVCECTGDGAPDDPAPASDTAPEAPPEMAYICPVSGEPLVRLDDCYWSPGGLYAYPILQGIPVLKPEYAIILTRPVAS